jgi:hypothetical protein
MHTLLVVEGATTNVALRRVVCQMAFVYFMCLGTFVYGKGMVNGVCGDLLRPNPHLNGIIF